MEARTIIKVRNLGEKPYRWFVGDAQQEIPPVKEPSLYGDEWYTLERWSFFHGDAKRLWRAKLQAWRKARRVRKFALGETVFDSTTDDALRRVKKEVDKDLKEI